MSSVHPNALRYSEPRTVAEVTSGQCLGTFRALKFSVSSYDNNNVVDVTACRLVCLLSACLSVRPSVRLAVCLSICLYKEIVDVCSEIHTKHIKTLYGQNVELLNVKLVVHIVTTELYRVKARL